MEQTDASNCFSILGHEGRLAVFRLLMRRAPQGVRPAEMVAALGFKGNTLSHHLSDLQRGGLVLAVRQGRSILYSVNLERIGALMGYLVLDCCRGRPDICAAFLPVATGAGGDGPTPSHRPFNVLFICSGNSARSIFAEAILTAECGEHFKAFSAGTRPGTALNPLAVDVLHRAGLDVTRLRAKHVSEFARADAPVMDFVFTVCDQAANEECAAWPGQPMTAHWGVADPARATGTEAEKALAFASAFAQLRRRIVGFCALPIAELSKLTLQNRLDAIGRAEE